jgi:hypothetical protein
MSIILSSAPRARHAYGWTNWIYAFQTRSREIKAEHGKRLSVAVISGPLGKGPEDSIFFVFDDAYSVAKRVKVCTKLQLVKEL